MKKCTQCGEVKPLSEFHRRKTGSKDGHRGECKDCRHYQYVANAFHKKAKEFYSNKLECTIDIPDGDLKVLHKTGMLEPMDESKIYIYIYIQSLYG